MAKLKVGKQRRKRERKHAIVVRRKQRKAEKAERRRLGR
jgi:hypothetical protein